MNVSEDKTLQVERVAIESVHEDAANLRKHSERNIDAIAASLRRFGQQTPIVVDAKGTVRAGNGRLAAARKLGWTHIDVVRSALAGTELVAYAIADNRTAELATWDEVPLAKMLEELRKEDLLDGVGFEPLEIDELLEEHDLFEKPAVDDVEPEPVPEEPVSRLGDLWILGEHRLLCGDSTNAVDVARVMDGKLAVLVIADPPYGMGKESDGVANDNLYRENLDEFQMKWWRAVRAHVTENGSVYVWGNAPDLWRLWYLGGLNAEGSLTVRNEIVWAKSSAPGMGSEDAHCYAPETERCLFLMRGQQFLGNQNFDEYWEGCEPLRARLCTERDKMGWKASDINRITGTQMAGHWFSKSQFQPIRPEHYAMLQLAAGGRAFVESYDVLCGESFPKAKLGGEVYCATLSEQMRKSRSYFDGAHDAMTDVWRFSRVAGEERFGHATPKPVAMMARAIRSSAGENELVLDPFMGTGPVLIAAQMLGRHVCAIEINVAYMDIAIRRWQRATNAVARLDGDGRTFNEITQERIGVAQ